MLIAGKFERPVDIFYCRDGHIGCSDGRKRLCVAQHLNQSGKDLKVAVKVNLLMGLIFSVIWHIMKTAKEREKIPYGKKTKTPERQLWGFLFVTVN